jgi:hypothetical protein
MRIRIECGLDSRSRAGFWKNDRAGVLTSFFSFKKAAKTRCGLDSRYTVLCNYNCYVKVIYMELGKKLCKTLKKVSFST